ncbi:MAG: N-acetylmuramic acid 6-phosphate etherase [Clostridiales bacterium]|jgi:N-acetylmuramic acid 6-phosphate etherase|nr:N-acetylmuramic acid 6-phosphate etherase [Clostridiales bacterium]MDN5281932.1 N-acetylmuramic acid 6-phosphate etherase [Candidatus Ozemobacter sp.]
MTENEKMTKKNIPLTETRNPRTMFIDRVSTRQAVKTFIEEDKAIVRALEAVSDNIARVVDMATLALKKGGRIIYMGAGTSGRLGVLDASECPPTFGVSPDRVIALIAGGPKAVTQAAEGAEDNRDSGRQDLEAIKLSSKDILIGITASGTTPYVVAGLEFARRLKVPTVLLCCNPYGELPEVDVLINPAVGPEVITGSTRLKSGTVCKMVLNMISSLSMVKIGKVYENLMVDLQATNDKLRKRALRIVMEGGRVPNYLAEAKLTEADGNVKLAIMLARTEMTPEQAKQKLKEAEGVLYKALGDTDYE